MSEINKNTSDENLKDRLEKIIEQKSNENSALRTLLKKIYNEIDGLHPGENEQNKKSK